VNIRVPQRDRTGRSIKPYLAVAACLVVAVVVAFSVIERWTPGFSSEEAGDEGGIEGAGRVVIGRPAGKSPPSSREPSAPGGAYKSEEFTFYKSLGGAAIPEPKLDPRAASPPPVRPKAEPRAPELRDPVGKLKTSYTVQVASFRDRATADHLATRLRRDRYVVTVARVVLPDAGVRYRVRVGTFKTRQDALRLADILKTKEKLDPFVALVTTEAPRL
jgi:hypothetical protein